MVAISLKTAVAVLATIISALPQTFVVPPNPPPGPDGPTFPKITISLHHRAAAPTKATLQTVAVQSTATASLSPPLKHNSEVADIFSSSNNLAVRQSYDPNPGSYFTTRLWRWVGGLLKPKRPIGPDGKPLTDAQIKQLKEEKKRKKAEAKKKKADEKQRKKLEKQKGKERKKMAKLEKQKEKERKKQQKGKKGKRDDEVDVLEEKPDEQKHEKRGKAKNLFKKMMNKIRNKLYYKLQHWTDKMVEKQTRKQTAKEMKKQMATKEMKEMMKNMSPNERMLVMSTMMREMEESIRRKMKAELMD